MADPAADSTGIHVETWAPENKVIVADPSGPTTINLKLLAYPAWRASINGQAVSLRENSETGQLMLLLPAGFSRTEIKFGRTADRSAGILISVVCVAALLGFWKRFAVNRKRSKNSCTLEAAAEQAA
jgi:hypothetical protein